MPKHVVNVKDFNFPHVCDTILVMSSGNGSRKKLTLRTEILSESCTRTSFVVADHDTETGPYISLFSAMEQYNKHK